jgi:hypothetical protein
MEGYAAARRRNTVETADLALHFSAGLKANRGQNHRPMARNAVIDSASLPSS